MLVVVAGGGTGGHLFPGLAVADKLHEREIAQVHFIGSEFGIEARVIPKTRYPFTSLSIRGLRGGGIIAFVAFVRQFPRAVCTAWRLLGRLRPSLVLGLGGYGSVPVVVAGWLRRVPIVLLEQNARPGLANRSLAYLSARVCTTFTESSSFFPPGKAVRTGNPVRRLATGNRPVPDHFTIFAFGGSQGAGSINRAMTDAAVLLKSKLRGLRVIHQTGAADEEAVREAYRAIGVEAEVSAFIQEMGGIYGLADLVVCRAGATTLAELTALAKAAILIPYPFAADDHQRANAEVMVRAGAAEMILDAELSGESLARRILSLAAEPARIAAMGASARKVAIPDAADRVLVECGEVLRGNQ